MTETPTALNKTTPSGAAEAIRFVRGSGISLYLHGGPGLAKSAVARQIADEEHIALIDLRLSQLAPEDVRGVPMPTEVDQMKGIIWIPPLVFPRDLAFEGTLRIAANDIGSVKFYNPVGNNGVPYCTDPEIEVELIGSSASQLIVHKRINSFQVQLQDQSGESVAGVVRWRVTGKAQAILALEEFNSATPSVMAASYQLILDRRIGDYVVPDGVMILALGNRDSDRGVTHQLAKPVANRFIHLEMEFSWEDWFTWAGNHHIHPEVLGYLSKWPTKINDFDPDSPRVSFATPRTWEFVSRLISRPSLPKAETLRALVCGALGDAIGTEFIQHRKFMADMPNIADILSGKVTTFKPSNPKHEMQIAYSVCVQMCYELKERAKVIAAGYTGSKADFNQYAPRKEWLVEADRGFAYAIDNFRPDVTIMAARLSVVVHKLQFPAKQMPRFAEFCNTYLAVLLG